MSKFKIGDKVKYTGNLSYALRGGVGTVIRAAPEWDVLVKFDVLGVRNCNVSSLTLVAPALQLREGGYYKTADGKIFGPMQVFFMSGKFIQQLGDGCLWNQDGSSGNGMVGSLHLVAEVEPPAPVPADDPHIVIVTIDGQLAPGSKPKTHPSKEAATAEARRLATISPGSEFAVYKRVTAVVASVSLKEVA
jgi:hypothetical protein